MPEISSRADNPSISGVFNEIDTFHDWDVDFYSPAEDRFYDEAVGRMFRLLGPRCGDLVLDAGCGVGTHSIRAALAGLQVHAVDFSRPALAEAEARAKKIGMHRRIRFDWADLTNTSLSNEAYPFVFSWGVIIHIPEVEKALDTLSRVVAPGGRLALYVTNKSALDFKIEALARSVRRRRHIKIERHPMGDGYWYRERHGDIWVWQLDIPAVIRYLEAKGCMLVTRQSGMLTEMHVRMPKLLRRPITTLNRLWFNLRLPSGPAEANLLVFEKPAKKEAASGSRI